MSEIIRRCPDCGRERAFAQHHAVSAWCADAIGGDCPEWYCLVCGATVLTGEMPVLFRSAGAARAAQPAQVAQSGGSAQPVQPPRSTSLASRRGRVA